MLSDIELLRAWREGDNARGQELCKRYFDSVARFFVNKLGDQTSDLVQETFLALVQGRDRIKDDARFRPYLFSIAYNVLKSHLRQRYRLPEDLMSHSIHDIAPGAETMLRDVEHLRLLKSALRRIPLSLQVALELRYWEKLSSVEISEVLSIPASTVRNHLGRARALLEEKMRNHPSSDPEMVASVTSDLDIRAEKLRGAIHRPAVAS